MQITEAQLFEMLGRLFAEIKVLTAENEILRKQNLALSQPQPEIKPRLEKRGYDTMQREEEASG